MNYVDLYDENGIKTTMNIENIIKIEGINYVIYSEINKSHYYIAKLDKDNNLDTNIPKHALEKCRIIMEEVIKNDQPRNQ